jgi:hypothetical protein
MGARRQGDVGAFEQRGDVRRGVRTYAPVGAVLADSRLGQAIEIAQQDLPFDPDARLAQEVVEVFLQVECEEGAEHMAANGGVGGMEDWARAQHRFGALEQSLHLQQIAIAQHRL